MSQKDADLNAAPSGMPVWKRGLDIVLLILLFPIVAPLMLAIACYIKLVSKGPVFFTQDRIGFLGKSFTCFKFRTMKVGACSKGHQKHLKELMQSDRPMVKLDHLGDKRLIPGGALLRASGLDELAQLINVARGEMSIIGPRPCLPYEFEEYEGWHKERLNAAPGITGFWQVNGKNKTTFEEMVHMDIRYTREMSLAGDLHILSKTFSVLLGQIREMLHLKKKASSQDTSNREKDNSK